jgi:hypothetical protein
MLSRSGAKGHPPLRGEPQVWQAARQVDEQTGRQTADQQASPKFTTYTHTCSVHHHMFHTIPARLQL